MVSQISNTACLHRMILGCIEVAKRNPNSADARSLHELVEPLEELINVAKELCTMAGGLDLVGALAALHRAVDELAGE